MSAGRVDQRLTDADRNCLFRRLVSTRLMRGVLLEKKIGDKLGKGFAVD